MSSKTRIKRATMSIFALIVILGASFTSKAQAIDINPGDLTLIVYGNSTEYYQDLGTRSALLASGVNTSINISASNISAVGGSNPLQWALVSFNGDPNTGAATEYDTTLHPITSAQLSNVHLNLAYNAYTSFVGANFLGDGSTSAQVSSGAPNAYSGLVDHAGNGSQGGAFPVSTTAGLGGTISVVEGDFDSVGNPINSSLRQIGAASLTSGGLLTINGSALAPVPLPASVVLLGTGLIGLIGLSRRKLMTA